MVSKFISQWIGASGTGQVVFFILFALIWIIAGLLKKASEASKRPGSTSARPTPHPQSRAAQTPGVPSLSDFLKRIQEMSQEAEELSAPPKAEAGPPMPRTAVRTPRTTGQPSIAKKSPPRPAPVRQPGLRRPGRPQEPPKPETLARIDLSFEKPPEAGFELPGVSTLVQDKLAKADTYAMGHPEEPQITHILGGPVTASEVKKGIILAEILGRPKALRRRRLSIPRH